MANIPVNNISPGTSKFGDLKLARDFNKPLSQIGNSGLQSISVLSSVAGGTLVFQNYDMLIYKLIMLPNKEYFVTFGNLVNTKLLTGSSVTDWQGNTFSSGSTFASDDLTFRGN